MEFRRARPGDGSGLGLVHVRSWQTTYKGIVPQELLDQMDPVKRGAWWEKILEQVETAGQFCWVAVDEPGTITGFVHGGPPQEPAEGYTSELYAIYLLESVQGQGVGRRLVRLLAQDLWDAEHRTMVLGALAENPACRFYEHLGGKPIREAVISRGGKDLVERWYGWTDLTLLLA